MKALTIFPDAGLNRPTVLESSAEGTIFLHSPQSRSKPDTEEHYSLNCFGLRLERERPTGAVRQALPSSHRPVKNAPKLPKSHFSACNPSLNICNAREGTGEHSLRNVSGRKCDPTPLQSAGCVQE